MRLASSPFSFRGQGYLGKIYRPYVKIEITSKKMKEWIPLEVLVDTGADYTLLPQRYAGLLGINIKSDCRPENTYGIGGGETIYQCKDSVVIKIGSFKKTIPVGFLSRNDVPALLGRLQALEVLQLSMKDKITIFEV